MNPATHVVEKFGGVTAVASALGVPHSTVLRWTYPRDRGGTGGVIPSRRQQELMQLARERGVELGPNDFFEAA